MADVSADPQQAPASDAKPMEVEAAKPRADAAEPTAEAKEPKAEAKEKKRPRKKSAQAFLSARAAPSLVQGGGSGLGGGHSQVGPRA